MLGVRIRRHQFALTILWPFLGLVTIPAAADHRALPPATEGAALKLQALVDEALQKNESLKAATHEVTVKEAEEGPKGSYSDPMLAFEAMNYPVDSFSNREFGMTGNQISLSQRIPFPGKLGRLSDAARSESDAQREMARQRRLEIVRDVRVAFHDLYAAYKKLDLLNEQKNLFGQLIGVTRSRYALGKVAQAEVLNLQVEQANLMDQILVQERQIKDRLGELNHLLGKSDHEDYVYGRPEEVTPSVFDFSKNTQKTVTERVLANGPHLKSRAAMLTAAESRQSYAKRGYLPDFEVKVGYTFRQPSPGDRGTDFVSAGVGITLPIWAGSKQSEEVRGAVAEKQRAEAMLAEERIRLSHMVHVLYAELEETHKRLGLFQGGVLPMARQAVNAGTSAYSAGKLDYATLISLINRRFQLEMNYFEALARFESKIAELEALAGAPWGT